MQTQKTTTLRSFPELGPDTVLNLAEAQLGEACSNMCRQLNSYINRVFELETLDGKRVIIKFYRPDRWPLSALEDEHTFLRELHEQEIPVVPPLLLDNGKSIGSYNDLHFSLFPYCGGRSSDEFTEEQWLEVGRLLGRSHAIGAVHPAKNRLVLSPNQSTRNHVDFILGAGVIEDPDQAREFSTVCDAFIAETQPLFDEVRSSRIHGDCHFSNIIYRPGESFFLIDFDDMVMGPAIQDLWMLLPGAMNESLLEIDYFLEGYETFHPFDRRGFRLVEPLRGMRFLHFIAWLTHQYVADGSAPIVPGFGSKEYWLVEISDLKDQLELIRQDDQGLGNML